MAKGSKIGELGGTVAGRPVGWPLILGVHAAQSHQAHLEEAQEASWGPLTMLEHSSVRYSSSVNSPSPIASPLVQLFHSFSASRAIFSHSSRRTSISISSSCSSSSLIVELKQGEVATLTSSKKSAG